MIIDTAKDMPNPLFDEIKKWRRDAKKFKQMALYDLLSDIDNYIKLQSKDKKEVKQGFTINSADSAFSKYIRARDNYTCQKCGTKYDSNSKGLQCSHHFSRRYSNIRYDESNACALCYNCHVFWYQKDVPEAGRWLENLIGKKQVDLLIAKKNKPQNKLTQSQIDELAQFYNDKCKELKNGKRK